MSIEIIKDRYGLEAVFITNDDGSTISMSKAFYDEQQAKLAAPGLTGEEIAALSK
jgi:hypothetical protein